MIAKLAAAALGLLAGITAATATPPSPDVLRELAPTGRLRAAINFGNPVLAQEASDGGEPRGVSADLARQLGRELGVPVEFVPFHEALQVSESADSGRWDVGFLAIDPVRGRRLDYTAPYVLIEGTYLAPANSTLKAVSDVDRTGIRVGVAKGSAYDLFLTRELKDATLVRAVNGAETYRDLAGGRIDVVAGVRQPLVVYAAAHPEVRVFDGRFMAIEQAMCLPKDRPAALAYLRTFISDETRSGFVADALHRSGQDPAIAAPASPSR